MTIRLRLTLLFTIITGTIFLFFALFIYFSAAGDRRNEFFNHLAKEAMTRANVLLDAGVEPEILQTIYLQNREILSEVEVAIYDPHFNLLYHDAEDIDFVKETPEMIDEIMEVGEIRFIQEGWEVIGLHFSYDDIAYVITAAAYDEYGYNKLRNLRNTLGLYWLLGVACIFLAGVFFSRRALQPVAQMTDKVEEITAKNLDLRLYEGNGKDELAELAITFNNMLDRLEQSFKAHKEFVSHIAHELRTPLTLIIGEIELSKTLVKDDARLYQALSSLLADAQKLSKLTTDLLDLAKASYDPQNVSLKSVRLDEIILDARQKLLQSNAHYKVELYFDVDDDDADFLTVRGNVYMLEIAFLNMMHNGCKFSEDHTARVYVALADNFLLLKFADNGIGIHEEDLPHVFSPFFRGRNHGFTDGSGIGLPLVQRIIKMHGGTVSITSEEGVGTTVFVKIPRHDEVLYGGKLEERINI